MRKLFPDSSHRPIATALAPMQDVTTLDFMNLIADYAAPDFYFTEFFRVHETSILEPHILASITQNKSGKPVFGQLIGESIPHMIRTAKELMKYPVSGVDLNMGCPAPKVYKKNVGGGLLKDVPKINDLLGSLRDAIHGRFTVKMRIGFDNPDSFHQVLELINKHGIDSLAVHGRTVKQMYRSEVNYELIKQAVDTVKCPVFANGNITSYEKAAEVHAYTNCAGLMIGRSAIRNPWIFMQIHQHFSNQAVFHPTLEDVYHYILKLTESVVDISAPPLYQAGRMKKFLNFLGQSVDPEGLYLKEMRKAQSINDLLQISSKYLIENDNAKKLFYLEPYEGVIARPNCEDDASCCIN